MDKEHVSYPTAHLIELPPESQLLQAVREDSGLGTVPRISPHPPDWTVEALSEPQALEASGPHRKLHLLKRKTKNGDKIGNMSSQTERENAGRDAR